MKFLLAWLLIGFGFAMTVATRDGLKEPIIENRWDRYGAPVVLFVFMVAMGPVILFLDGLKKLRG